MEKGKIEEKNKNNNPLLARELEALAFWDKAKIFEKSVDKKAPQGDFVFYEGPPTANGLPGIHHVLARAFKDVLPRYKTMRGFRVERKAGWDTHGLPVELQVEKELGISGKPEIEKYGIEEFNKKCQESVWRYVDEWEKLTRRIAFWVDMEHPYITYENYYIESLWWTIKEFNDKGLLYKGHKVVPHCPRCGTALSSHEVAQGYRKVKENSVYLKFKIKYPSGKTGRGVGALIRNDKGEVLLVKRNEKGRRITWALPGGKVEASETFLEALKREVKEELGAEVDAAKPFCGLPDILEGRLFETICYEVKLKNEPENMIPDELEKIGWFPLNKLPDIDYPPSRDAINIFLNHREKFYLTEDVSRPLTGVYILAWTTTPWTLPGNVALAVGENIDYAMVKIESEFFVLAKDRLSIIKQEYELVKEFKGKELVNITYEPLFEIKAFKVGGQKAHFVADADFVTTADGTGVVHTAVMYGEDDYTLGEKIGLPKVHTVDESGHFTADLSDYGLAGKFVKNANTEKAIIDYLREKGKLFGEEMYEHDYPFCWRCDSPLLYYAKDSWFIKMTAVRDELIANNEKINWVPAHIKEGRFGEWLSGIKDWAISRERYWGTPLPVWECEKCGKAKCIGSRDDLDKQLGAFYIVRHGEAENNVKKVFSTSVKNTYHLTKDGKKAVEKTAEDLKEKQIEIIYTSDLTRAKETAEILARSLKVKIIEDERLREVDTGDLDGKPYDEDLINKRNSGQNLSYPNGENWTDVKARVADFYKGIQLKHEKALIVSHGDTLAALEAHLDDRDFLVSIKKIFEADRYMKKGGSRELKHKVMDLHRPYVDNIKFECACGGEMIRDKAVLDCWFDSGSMPFAQQHYPFENKKHIEKGKQYPADYICEAIDQTRGWFYTLHAVATALGRGNSFKNVICLGHINDRFGKKMSKSKGNIINPWDVIALYGVDAVRLHMYTINQPGEGKNYDLNDVRDVFRKNVMILWNVHSFYAMYAGESKVKREKLKVKSENILDKWIIARLHHTADKITYELEKYHVYEAAREIPLFINDLSTWYLRRSRERFKVVSLRESPAIPQNCGRAHANEREDKEAGLATLGFVLAELSKVMAPFMPFIAESLWQKVTGYDFKDENQSVHLEKWPSKCGMRNAECGTTDGELRIIGEMEGVRKIVELGLAERDKAGIKVRQPLRELRIKNYELRSEYVELIQDELNVKAVKSEKGSGEISAELDLKITPELKLEGIKRELVRSVNNMRKEAGLTIGDKIEIGWNAAGDIAEAMKIYGKEIRKETLADKLVIRNDGDGKTVLINGEKAVLEIRKLGNQNAENE